MRCPGCWGLILIVDLLESVGKSCSREVEGKNDALGYRGMVALMTGQRPQHDRLHARTNQLDQRNIQRPFLEREENVISRIYNNN